MKGAFGPLRTAWLQLLCRKLAEWCEPVPDLVVLIQSAVTYSVHCTPTSTMETASFVPRLNTHETGQDSPPPLFAVFLLEGSD